MESEEDSGDENLSETIKNFSGKQLQSSAEVEVTTVGNTNGGSTLLLL